MDAIIDAATITAIGLVVTAIGMFVTAIGTVWVNIYNARVNRQIAMDARADAAEARKNTIATLAATENTARKVDGQTHELMAAISGQKLAEGKVQGITHEQERIVAQKLAEGPMQPAAAPVPVEIISPAPVPVVVTKK